MGEVFQAKDQVLGREVAIKILPEEFARDADRVARFQREAKVLASLNHPNIAAIYGLEQSEGKNFLVLELVEGQTLAGRIKAGPIPVEESLKLALQIAEALEAAHEKGVIHRDLKPANIKVTPDGKVKVLDFGLAKAYAGDQEGIVASDSPTLTLTETQKGVILGTVAYMSPEQARGKAVDKRADIWAFGCVLFEMLTGQAAFRGEDVSEILASVIKGDMNLDLLPANIHPRVREAITRCLQKDLKRRYRDIADARYETEQALADASAVLVQPVTALGPGTRLQTILPWIAAVIGIAIVGVAVWKLKPAEPRQVTRSVYSLPEGQQLNTSFGLLTLAVSPDGRQFVYATAKGLYLRSLGEFDAKLISGTETNATNPFFSRDGKWIGYYSATDQTLKKIAISGGASVTLCDVSSMMVGASWGADDNIVYAETGQDIKRVSANGGTPEVIVKGLMWHPQLLSDGESLLYTFGSGPPYKIIVQSLQSGERKELFTGDYAQYIPTGHIVYSLGYNLFAVPFDLKSLKVTGGPVSVVEGIWRALPVRSPQYAVSGSGTLAYIPGSSEGAAAERTLVWINREGKEEPLSAPPNNYVNPRISPDGKRVALTVLSGPQADIWTWDVVRETLTRLTFESAHNDYPLWTRDGKRIAFLSYGGEKSGIYWKAADGTGNDELINSLPYTMIPSSWSADGKTLVVYQYELKTPNFDIGTLSMEGDYKWRPLLQEKHNEFEPRISANGQWIAYTSDESGKYEVYVRPFPEVDGGRWQVSSGGGLNPLWSPDGRELFYRNGEAVMAVSVKTDPTFSLETSKWLFRGEYVSASVSNIQPWDISPDGKRFLMLKESETSATQSPRRINIVLNWLEELKGRVPVD